MEMRFISIIFICSGAVVLWLLGTIFSQHYASLSWVATPAKLLSAGIKTYDTRRPNIAFTSKVEASYSYSYRSIEYSGTQIDFGIGSDNFSNTRQARQMELLNSPSLVVYVNPDRPFESVIDRSLPIGQINIALLFLLFPCGAGTLMALVGASTIAEKAGWTWPERFIIPVFGFFHSLPALYAPLFAPGDLGAFSWCIAAVAGAVMLFSIRSIWRRIKNPTIGQPAWEKLSSKDLSGYIKIGR